MPSRGTEKTRKVLVDEYIAVHVKLESTGEYILLGEISLRELRALASIEHGGQHSFIDQNGLKATFYRIGGR